MFTTIIFTLSTWPRARDFKIIKIVMVTSIKNNSKTVEKVGMVTRMPKSTQTTVVGITTSTKDKGRPYIIYFFNTTQCL